MKRRYEVVFEHYVENVKLNFNKQMLGEFAG